MKSTITVMISAIRAMGRVEGAIMGGSGTTLAIILVLGAALILLVWGVFTIFPTVTRPSTRSFWCPFREKRVTAEFQEDAWDGKRVEVNLCSTFSPPTAVTCEKLCLRLDTLPSAKSEQRPSELAG